MLWGVNYPNFSSLYTTELCTDSLEIRVEIFRSSLSRVDSVLRNSLAPTRLQGIEVTLDPHSVAWVLGTPSEDHGKIILLKNMFIFGDTAILMNPPTSRRRARVPH